MVDSSLKRRENLFAKVVKSDYTIEEILEFDKNQWYNAGFSTKKLNKDSLRGAKNLLKQVQKRAIEILDYHIQKEKINNPNIIEGYIKASENIFKIKIRIPSIQSLDISDYNERFDNSFDNYDILKEGSYFVVYLKDKNDKEFWVKCQNSDELIEQIQKIENAGSGNYLQVESISVHSYTEFRDKMFDDLMELI